MMKTRSMAPPTLTILFIILTLAVAIAGVAAGPLATAAIGATIRVSVASDGAQANHGSGYPSISDDGRYVAFQSDANNLVHGDTNDANDIFVHSLTTGETIRISISSDGEEGNGWSSNPSISGDGRHVAFQSDANNLVHGDTNDANDIFVHSLTTGETTLVSIATDGAEGNGWSSNPSISEDGRHVAFVSSATNLVLGDTNDANDIFVHDRMMGETIRISVGSGGMQGNWSSSNPSISSDGRYVAFGSGASNLVEGDTNETSDVFVHDRTTGETTRISIASDGTQGNSRSTEPSISGDGHYVIFTSLASNLVAGDTNEFIDVFVHDRTSGETTRVSVASDGTQSNDDSVGGSLSGDGRYVAFASYADNLAPGDTNRKTDIFVHDRTTAQTTRVSVASGGTQGNDHSAFPSISSDGRYVAFDSRASNLVPEDTNDALDLFVHDRTPEHGVVLSVYAKGMGAPGTMATHSLVLHNVAAQPDNYDLALSGNSWPTAIDGPTSVKLAAGTSSEVAVVVSVPLSAQIGDSDTVMLSATSHGDPNVSDTAKLTTVVINAGATARVSVASDDTQGNGWSGGPSISGDSRYVAFYSSASNLVPGDTNECFDSSAGHCRDVFVHDRMTGETTRVSVASDGTEGNGWSEQPNISSDGRYVALASSASNLVPGDTNGCLEYSAGHCPDVFVHDRMTGETTRVSVASDGTEGNGWSEHPSISGNGRYVAFHSDASNLVPRDTNYACGRYGTSQCADVFVHDRVTGETRRVSVASDGTQGNYGGTNPSISDDGRYVAFSSFSSNLVPEDTNTAYDVFVHDQITGETGRISVAFDGTEIYGGAGSPSISGDGRYVAFYSYARNLVPGDTNETGDVFVHDRVTGETTRISVASDGTEGNSGSAPSSISGDGRYVAFGSDASNLVTGDTNGYWDAFVHDRMRGETTRVSVASDGTQFMEGNDHAGSSSISGDGRYVAFQSYASNLVTGDTNECFDYIAGHCPDIFVHDRAAGYGVSLTGNRWQMGTPGMVVTYTLLLRNTGALPDTYALALSGGAWESTVDGATTVAMAAGASSEVTVVVVVPEGSTVGDSDIIKLSATSQESPFVTDVVDLTTTTGGQFNTILPLVFSP